LALALGQQVAVGQLRSKARANAHLEQLIRNQAAQVATLEAIDAAEGQLAAARAEQSRHVATIEAQIAARQQASRPLAIAFEMGPNDLDGMSFGFEEQIQEEVVNAVSDRFNKLERSTYVNSETRTLDILKAQAEPASFLEAVASKSQKLVKGVDPEAAVKTAWRAASGPISGQSAAICL
jgi:hypothetical protein